MLLESDGVGGIERVLEEVDVAARELVPDVVIVFERVFDEELVGGIVKVAVVDNVSGRLKVSDAPV